LFLVEKKIRQYLIDSNYVDAVIQLPANLFFGTSIATCIMVLKKSKADTTTVFIDASKEYVKVTNSNKLSQENIENILKLYTDRVDAEHIVRVVKGAEIAARLHEDLFYDMESPVLRVTGYDIPYPPSRLEDEFLPSADRILDALDRSLAW